MNNVETSVHYIETGIPPTPTYPINLVVQRDSNLEIKNDYGIWFYTDKRLEVGQGSRKHLKLLILQKQNANIGGVLTFNTRENTFSNTYFKT